jgi:ADP-heptose:LPS heptosyltransferase
MRIAVFIQNRDFFGARLVHLPLLEALRGSFPDARLAAYAPFASADFFREVGLADETRIYTYGLRAMRRSLLEFKPDLVLSLRPFAQWLDLAIGTCGAPRRIGYRTSLSRLMYTDTVIRDVSVYRALHFLNLLEPLGIRSGTEKVFRRLAAGADPAGLPERPYIVLIPAGGEDVKWWGGSRFFQLARRLREKYPDRKVVFLLGMDGEIEPGEPAAEAAEPWMRIFSGEKVGRLSRILAGAEAVVSQDCGPGHVAQMLRVPFVGLFHNRDGRAGERIAEWFLARKGAEALAPASGMGVETIPVSLVVEAVERVRGNPLENFLDPPYVY